MTLDTWWKWFCGGGKPPTAPPRHDVPVYQEDGSILDRLSSSGRKVVDDALVGAQLLIIVVFVVGMLYLLYEIGLFALRLLTLLEWVLRMKGAGYMAEALRSMWDAAFLPSWWPVRLDLVRRFPSLCRWPPAAALMGDACKQDVAAACGGTLDCFLKRATLEWTAAR